jgi:hypothetical protein
MSGFEALIIIGLTFIKMALPILGGILGLRFCFDILSSAGRGYINW